MNRLPGMLMKNVVVSVCWTGECWSLDCLLCDGEVIQELESSPTLRDLYLLAEDHFEKVRMMCEDTVPVELDWAELDDILWCLEQRSCLMDHGRLREKLEHALKSLDPT